MINLLALAYVKAIPTESNSFLRSQRANLAHYACEAGVNDSLAFITFELKEGREPTPDGAISRSGTHNGWRWTATITPDAASPPNGSSALRCYEVLSKSFPPDSDTPARLIRATVGEETFARYTNYVDVFPGSVYQHLLGTGTFIEGHVHTNSYFRMLVPDERYAGPMDPAFAGYVTSAGAAPSPWDYDGVNYRETSQAPYDESDAHIPGRYERIFMGGRSGVNTSVNRIDMPEHSGGLARRAWGDDTARPTENGIHFRLKDGSLKGGYYVVGDIDSLKLSADDGVAKLVFKQGSATTTIVEGHEGGANLGGQRVGLGSTGIQYPDGTVRVVPGVGNGLFHCTGDIEGLEGTNLGPRLISASLEDYKRIMITGSLLRADTRPGSRPNGPRDVLGLVTYQVVISKTIPRDRNNPLYLYTSYLAGKAEDWPQGGFIVEDPSDPTLGRGVIYKYGAAGAGTTYATGDSSLNAGYGYRHYYDQHAVNNPPPFYPTTGKLPIRSWREEDGAL